jgi:hypothetical protein
MFSGRGGGAAVSGTDPIEARGNDAPVAGWFAQFEKSRLVSKLRGARERIRETQGKCEGRKSYAERDTELVLAAKRLHRRSPTFTERTQKITQGGCARVGRDGLQQQTWRAVLASGVESMLSGS